MDTYNGQAQSGSGQKIPLGMYRVGGGGGSGETGGPTFSAVPLLNHQNGRRGAGAAGWASGGSAALINEA